MRSTVDSPQLTGMAGPEQKVYELIIPSWRAGISAADGLEFFYGPGWIDLTDKPFTASLGARFRGCTAAGQKTLADMATHGYVQELGVGDQALGVGGLV